MAVQRTVPIYHPEPPTQAQLEMKARDAMKSSDPKAYKKMSRAEIEKTATAMALAVIRDADAMGGTPQAWQTAIRQDIYDSATD